MIRLLPSGWDNNGRQLQWRQSGRAGRRSSKRSTAVALCVNISASAFACSRPTWPVTLEHSLEPAGPIRWAISASVDIAMNFSASLVERTIVTVDYFINRAISGAWESVCRSALGYKRQQPLPEEDYGGGDICSLEETHSTEDDQPLE